MGTVLYLRNENIAYIGNRKRQRMPESRIKKGNSVLEISLNRLNGWKRNIIAVNFEKARVLLESVKRILMTEIHVTWLQWNIGDSLFRVYQKRSISRRKICILDFFPVVYENSLEKQKFVCSVFIFFKG